MLLWWIYITRKYTNLKYQILKEISPIFKLISTRLCFTFKSWIETRDSNLLIAFYRSTFPVNRLSVSPCLVFKFCFIRDALTILWDKKEWITYEAINVCSHTYPACKEQTPYYIFIWGVSGSFFFCIFVFLYFCMFVCLYFCIFVSLYFCIFEFLYFCIFVFLYFCIFIALYLCIFVFRIFEIWIFVFLCLCIFVFLYFSGKKRYSV